jgi:hypothetical protein
MRFAALLSRLSRRANLGQVKPSDWSKLALPALRFSRQVGPTIVCVCSIYYINSTYDSPWNAFCKKTYLVNCYSTSPSYVLVADSEEKVTTSQLAMFPTCFCHFQKKPSTGCPISSYPYPCCIANEPLPWRPLHQLYTILRARFSHTQFHSRLNISGRSPPKTRSPSLFNHTRVSMF